MFTCTKFYADLPFAHRQHRHAGHCRFIHGHNWGFEFTFGCSNRDFNGFVIDFGELKWLKAWLNEQFDHTLVLNADDPALGYLKEWLVDPKGADPEFVELFPFADIRVVPNASSEGLAHWVFDEVDRKVREITSGRVRLVRCVVREDEKNSAAYEPKGACHHG